ncbi:gas vesicle protein [Streptomyces fungicidicus]|uniref:Gas vesicle protein n=1 Tax=Streptomyces fungicidicus TaxID=68203 RepID=A0A494V9V9_9ACTN|nr:MULTISPECIES: gas vesicle protein [Streptomyces]AYL40444.1 gas vesicle protein [Streptomyces fungicidicus]QKV98371.1 gas vesicle protein [Streptomyces sp. NA02536]
MPEQRHTRPSTPSKGTRARGASGAAGQEAVTRFGPEKAARTACDWLQSFIVHRIESVCAVRRTEDGWCVAVDVLEVARIPDTTSLLATYEVELDGSGRPAEYRRVCRYHRGTANH